MATLATAGKPRGHLHKVLGLTFALAIGVGNVIGSGIMRTPGEVLDIAPVLEVALVLWLAGGLHCLLIANTVSELITAVPKAGGGFVPVRMAFGDAWGLLAGWTDWLAFVAGVAALAVVSAEFLALLVPGLADYTAITATALALASGILHLVGVKQGATVEIAGSLLKTAFLVGVIVAVWLAPPLSASAAASTAAAIGEPLGLLAIVVAYQLVYGAYSGWTGPIYFVEEDEHAQRDIPRGILFSLLTITAVYVLLNATLLYSLPLDALRQSDLPVATLLEALFGETGGKIVVGGAVLLAASCLHGNVMVTPRILYGMGRDGLFPKFGMRINAGGTPDLALLLSLGLAVILIFSGGFDFLFRMMGALTIFVFVIYQASLFGLRRKMPELDRPYRARFYPWLPGAMLTLDTALLGLFLWSDLWSAAYMLGLIAICIPIGHHLSRAKQREAD